MRILTPKRMKSCPLVSLAAAVELPFPPGVMQTLYNNDHLYGFIPEFGDKSTRLAMPILDEDGYLSVMARTDDVINTAGHRLSTGQMEEIVSTHPSVAECAVIGADDELKGQVPVDS